MGGPLICRKQNLMFLWELHFSQSIYVMSGPLVFLHGLTTVKCVWEKDHTNSIATFFQYLRFYFALKFALGIYSTKRVEWI